MLRKISDFFLGCIRQVDLVLLALCTGATLFGCLMIASATHYTGSYKNVIVQLAALCLGIVAYVLMSMLDLAEVSKRWKWLLGASLVLIFLLKTPLGMDGGTGNRAWLGVSGLPAGPAACLPAGEPGPEIHPLHRPAGRPSGPDRGGLRCGVRRHGQCLGAYVHLCLYVLCGRGGQALVRHRHPGRQLCLLCALGGG